MLGDDFPTLPKEVLDTLGKYIVDRSPAESSCTSSTLSEAHVLELVPLVIHHSRKHNCWNAVDTFLQHVIPRHCGGNRWSHRVTSKALAVVMENGSSRCTNTWRIAMSHMTRLIRCGAIIPTNNYSGALSSLRSAPKEVTHGDACRRLLRLIVCEVQGGSVTSTAMTTVMRNCGLMNPYSSLGGWSRALCLA
eukprot:PhF_6_TR19663/c0_g1_i2/m.28710